MRPGSPAWCAGLRPRIPSGLYSDKESSACITQVNEYNVDIYSKNNSSLLLIFDAISIQSNFIIIAQPHDFIKELQKGFRKFRLKNFSR